MKFIRGYVGIGIVVAGIILLFPEQTKNIAPVFIGLGLGMALSGFDERHN